MSANYRSRVLRESLRESNNSVASSTGSQHGTVSPDSTMSNASFMPDQDDPYSESTRVFGTPNLPRLRDTANKYKYPTRRSQSPESLINTSALRKTFTNFSDDGSPADRIYMEKIARLAAQSSKVHPTPTAKPTMAESTNQLITPTLKEIPRDSTSKEQIRRDPIQQKENITPSAYVSGATRTRDGQVRRTLEDLHPKVRDESDYSFVSDRLEKSSRFSTTDYTQQSQNTTNTQQAKPQPPTKASRNVSQKTPPSKPVTTQKATPYRPQAAKMSEYTLNSSNTRNQTQQSFLLPKNVPEISELVTATFKDGSPVYVQSGAVQSRFSHSGKPLPHKHVPVDSIEVPQDEQDIFNSLQIMQERITQLEGDKSDAQRIANDLDKENCKLREDLKQAIVAGRRRSDSAIASDPGAEAEKSKLQDEINMLKVEAEASKRKIQTLELHLSNNTTERDRAISRVAEFNKTCEALKSENIGLQNEVDALRQQGEHIATQREASQQELQHNEASWQNLRAELEHKISVQEDQASGYERYITGIRTSYSELQERESSLTDEITSMRHQLETARDLYSNSLKTHQQKEDESMAKVYRLEKALRRVLSLKYEKEMILNQQHVVSSVPEPALFMEEALPPSTRTPKEKETTPKESIPKDATPKETTPHETSISITPQPPTSRSTPQKPTSSVKEVASTTQKTTGKLSPKKVTQTPQKPTPLAKEIVTTTQKTAGNETGVFSLKIKSDPIVGPRAALTNAALKASGYDKFPWEYHHNDDLTQTTEFESVLGEGKLQELRDDVNNANLQTANAPQCDVNPNNMASEQGAPQQPHPIFQYQEKTNEVKSKSRRDETKRVLSDSHFTDRQMHTGSFYDATPVEKLQQRVQRRRSEGSVDVTGNVNQTVDSISERSVFARNRSQSQSRTVENTGRLSKHRRSNSDNMTSAYIIPDLDASLSTIAKQVRPGRRSSTSVCVHGFPYQGPEQCDDCVSTVSSIIDAHDSHQDSSILIPVSERKAAASGVSDSTLRPSMPPMSALAKVVKSLLEEENSIKQKLNSFRQDLNSFDSSVGRNRRNVLAAAVRKLEDQAQKKADQIYFLYDVLEGLKDTEEWEGIQD